MGAYIPYKNAIVRLLNLRAGITCVLPPANSLCGLDVRPAQTAQAKIPALKAEILQDSGDPAT